MGATHPQQPERAAQTPLRVLFVCTGNIYRSLTAEYALRAAAREKGLVSVFNFASAGTNTRPDRILRADVLAALAANGLDGTAHRSRPLTQDIIDQSDIIIAMDETHVAAIKDRFNRDAVLYLGVSRNLHVGIPDLPDVVPDFRTNIPAAEKCVHETVGMIAGERYRVLRQLPVFAPRPR